MIQHNRFSRWLGAGAATLALACAPDGDPVSTRIPPRDPDGAALRQVTLVADSLDAINYTHDANFATADRILFGTWEGIVATALIRFDREAFAVFEGDTLAGSTVFDSELSFNCVEGQGPADELDVTIRGVSTGKSNDWTEGELDFPGPAIDDMPSSGATVENCELDDAFPEQTYTIPDAIIESWIADSTSNNGLALTSASTGILQFASSENNIVNLDSTVVTVSGPRLRFRAIRPGGDTTSVFLSEDQITGDDYLLSPDGALLLCADSTDCLRVSQGVTQRVLVRPRLESLPRGSNVHRAVLRLHVLGHPRFDRDLELEVLRLTSAFPDSTPVDSLITTSGTIWHEAELLTTDTVVDIPITQLLQSWYDGAFVNEGFLIRAGQEDRGVTAVAFASSTHPDPALRPTIVIDYTVPLGGRP